LELKKNGYDNLFNTCVNYYNTKLDSELNGFLIENVEFYNGNQIYSLQLVIKDWSDSGNLILDFDYKVNDYSDEQIEDIYTRLLNLANYIIINPSEKVRIISLLTNDERKKLLYDFNTTETEYPKNKTIYQLFEEQVEKTPYKVAICFNDIELTYRQLNEKANQLARYLVKIGVNDETIVGLLTTHSIETVIGSLGILKAGGAYLPIDPSYPSDRIR
jgi:non-ribosomal peptide synthetase component F